MESLPQLTGPLTKRQLELWCKRERIESRVYHYPEDRAAVKAIDAELIQIEEQKSEERRLKWASMSDKYFLNRRRHFESDDKFFESVRKFKPKSLLLPENQVVEVAA